MEKSKVTIRDCTLYCEDAEFILPTLSKVDALVVDPPYGISFAAQPTKWQRRDGAKPKDWDDNKVDLSTSIMISQYQIIWGGNYYALPPSRGWLCWLKPDSPPSMGDFEMAWTNLNINTQRFTYSISATNAERVGHPTQKTFGVDEMVYMSAA